MLSAVTMAALLALTGCGEAGDAASEVDRGPRVVATVAPLRDLVATVMGARGELTGLVPAGVDSHTYEPTTEDARALSSADLLIANGLWLEEPVLRLAAANLGDDAVVTLAEQTISRDEWIFDRSFPEDKGLPNPHLWLDVTSAMEYVAAIRDALVAVDPDGAAVYEANAERLLDELAALDAAIAAAIATIPDEHRKLVTYHDSWPYFGRRYDIEPVAAVQPTDLSEPSAAEVRRIIEQVRAEEVPAVFGSEVFPSDVVAVIAEEAGAEYVEELADDELPGDAGDPEHSYVGMMVRNVRSMVTHLGGDPSPLDPVDPAR